MRLVTSYIIALVALTACDAGKQTTLGVPEPLMAAGGDSTAIADPLTSAQRFAVQPDGGDIVVERGIHDDLGINQIRSRLLLIARSFSRGDFAIPGFIREKPIPGTAVMAARADKISYTVEDLDHGGVVHIRTSDAEALRAIHDFIAFVLAERGEDQDQ